MHTMVTIDANSWSKAWLEAVVEKYVWLEEVKEKALLPRTESSPEAQRAGPCAER